MEGEKEREREREEGKAIRDTEKLIKGWNK